MYIYLETRAASKFWCWSSKTVFHLIAAEISGMRRSLGNKYGFRFWCWNAPFLPMIAPFLPVIAPSLPVQNFHCAVFVELRHVFYIAPFLWTCAWFFCRLGMRPKFWIHESLGIYTVYMALSENGVYPKIAIFRGKMMIMHWNSAVFPWFWDTANIIIFTILHLNNMIVTI